MTLYAQIRVQKFESILTEISLARGRQEVELRSFYLKGARARLTSADRFHFLAAATFFIWSSVYSRFPSVPKLVSPLLLLPCVRLNRTLDLKKKEIRRR